MDRVPNWMFICAFLVWSATPWVLVALAWRKWATSKVSLMEDLIDDPAFLIGQVLATVSCCAPYPALPTRNESLGADAGRCARMGNHHRRCFSSCCSVHPSFRGEARQVAPVRRVPVKPRRRGHVLSHPGGMSRALLLLAFPNLPRSMSVAYKMRGREPQTRRRSQDSLYNRKIRYCS
jgi:hypothetical protein